MQDEYQTRLQKLEEIKKAGINPYPSKFCKQNFVIEIKESDDSKELKTAGRLMTIREMGKLAFCHLQDSSGKAQIALKEDELGKDKFKFFLKHFDMGDFIGVEGEVFTTQKGEKTLLVKDYKLLCKAVLPLPEKWHGLKDIEERFRKRYLDLIASPEVKKRFEIRSAIIETMRQFLIQDGYIEVETPVLQPIYGGTSAKPFVTHHNALDIDLYLRIADEMYLKRLIAGGFEKIFEFCRDFRNEGIDHSHNPEFTIMETMWAYADYKDNMELVEKMHEDLADKVLGKRKIKFASHNIDLSLPWKRVKMVEIVKQETGHDFNKIKDLKEAQKVLQKLNIESDKKLNSVGEILAKVFEEKVEAKLIQPTIIYDYPVETSPLAKRCEDDSRYVQRFEHFIAGFECSNNYSELNDPAILVENWQRENQKRKAGDEEAQPMDEDFIEMLKHGMPPTSGIGIGIDRLVMLFTNSQNIKEVIFFPTMKPKSQKTQKH